MALLTCENASFAYEGKAAAKNINFSVESGDYLCIVGENGAGKSTLMKGLLRLKSPTSGSICLGEGLQTNEIGYLPQQTEVQKDFPASVYEVVLSGCLNRLKGRPFYGRAEKELAAEKLEQLGITALKHRAYRELSGGQQQRVAIARALVARPSVLIADEPTAQLDSRTAASVMDLLIDLATTRGVGMVIATHDPAMAERADRIAEITDGRLSGIAVE